MNTEELREIVQKWLAARFPEAEYAAIVVHHRADVPDEVVVIPGRGAGGDDRGDVEVQAPVLLPRMG